MFCQYLLHTFMNVISPLQKFNQTKQDIIDIRHARNVVFNHAISHSHSTKLPSDLFM
jgi:hypothetical protein